MGSAVDRKEKKRLREHVGEHLDVSHARLTDDEAVKCAQFVDEYDENYKGHSVTRTHSHDGWSSDGKSTREETFTETFTDDVGIRFDYEYRDDDGQTGSSTSVVNDARGILNWLRRN
ncbi:hypothetical protein [Agromyces sp. Marseille-P2726]|uniref:hypothetical protein n=1 Tax=Agromyces sp. Marseille-P2726 TaxID=2709132 RepID=UPI0020C3C714|nr:hypothetical protein [Agromyces sp. Marseille-P2726]